MPFLIGLARYVRGPNRASSLPRSSFIAAPRRSQQVDQHALEERLRRGDCLVLFDGLDEVFDLAERDTILTQIVRFSTLPSGPASSSPRASLAIARSPARCRLPSDNASGVRPRGSRRSWSGGTAWRFRGRRAGVSSGSSRAVHCRLTCHSRVGRQPAAADHDGHPQSEGASAGPSMGAVSASFGPYCSMSGT